jgi:hypothetical protein
MSEENKNMDMDWDSPISAEASNNEYNLPPVGEYGFTVESFEKTFSKAGKKMAKIVLKLDKEAQFFHVYDYLVLTENMAWKLAQFFECLSLKKRGEPLDHMPWDKVLGASGRVKIKHEDYNGTESCKVDRYIVSDAAQAPTAPKKASAKKTKTPEEDLPFEV